MRRPIIRRGARVALVAPAGPLGGEGDLQQAMDNVRSFGWEPVAGASVLAREGYLAGTDEQRLSDLNSAIADDSIDAIWCIRGGYGAMRLIEHVDYAGLRQRVKALIGYSDITALHAAIGTRCDIVSYHGPTARATITPFSHDSFERALRGDDPFGPAPRAETLRGGRARGRLVGGNLALLCALIGTKFEPSYEEAILVLEDVNEAVYRIDRMLTQLRLTGHLSRCRGLVFGQFTDIPRDSPEESVGARNLDDVLGEVGASLRIPCIVGAPVGHIADQWTFPLGAEVELDATERTLRILK